MRIKSHHTESDAGTDLTPMIDIVFQLIAFFMVIINFTETEQNENVKLPSSVLARPPDVPHTTPLTLQLGKSGEIYFSGHEVTLEGLTQALQDERNYMQYINKNPSDATIIIRADEDAKAGLVQELITTCQEVGFENFVLRAKQEDEA